MTHLISYRFFIVILVFLFSISAHAQYDVSNLDLSANTTDWFDEAIGIENLNLISGSYGKVNGVASGAHKFFETYLWTELSLNYNGQHYDELFGLYDISEDILLLRHPTNIHYYSQPLVLKKSNIENFIIADHFFKHYSKQEAPNSRSGFYDQLLISEHLELIVRRKKEISLGTIQAQVDYDITDAYFLLYQGRYNRISGRRSIIKTLIEYKKPLRRYIRQNGLIISLSIDDDLIELLEYGNSLITD